MKRRKIKDLLADRSIVELQDGNHGEKHPTASDYVDDGIPFVMARDFRDGQIDLRSACKIPKALGDSLRVGFAKTGDVLLTHKGTIGLVAIVPDVPSYVMLTPQVTYYRTNSEKLLNSYLKYVFQAPSFRHQLASFSAQSTRPYVGITAQRELEIEVPPLDVQRQIADVLSNYDEMIDNSQRRSRILESMARALYCEWFVHFRFPGHEGTSWMESCVGRVPTGWDIVAFTDVADVLSGGTPKTSVAEYWNGEVPFFTPRDAPECFYVQETEKHVTRLGLSKCASELYPPDTVFITARGTVGKVALSSVPMAMNQSCYALRAKGGISQRYLFLQTLQQVDYLKTNTGGATFDTIVVDTFSRMQVLRPPRSVVAEFDKRVEAMFDQIKTLQHQTRNLCHTRDLLIPRLLSA
ncbi:MAG: restriction endonuclease subunit S [Candidatus Binatia bacterium]